MNAMNALAIARRIGSRRFFGMLAGVCLCGLGISVFKLAAMGNDAYSALVFALSARFPIGFGTMLLLMNALFFLGECIWGRQMIGLGTVVNWLCVGYVADFFFRNAFCVRSGGTRLTCARYAHAGRRVHPVPWRLNVSDRGRGNRSL